MEQEKRRCGFCDKAKPEIEYLFAGFDDIYICEKCIEEYMKLLEKCRLRKGSRKVNS